MKPELVLSNTTSFFIGGMPALFRNARRYGFKYVEIVPYRWTTPQQIIDLANRYSVQVAGIHLPAIWDKPVMQQVRDKHELLDKFFTIVFHCYLGQAANNPATAIAHSLPQQPYLLIHSNVAIEMESKFEELSSRFHTVVENIPYKYESNPAYWDPLTIEKELRPRGMKALVFDPGHYDLSLAHAKLGMIEAYQYSRPEVVHISYNSTWIHLLPNKKEQTELVSMLRIHQPRYIVIETNPLVSIKKGKALLEKIIGQALG